MQNRSATPEQADMLGELLDEWGLLLKELDAKPEIPSDVLGPSRKIRDNLARTLRADLQRGIDRVPASELFKAMSIANASIDKLKEIRSGLD